jgi:hypothetical protein
MPVQGAQKRQPKALFEGPARPPTSARWGWATSSRCRAQMTTRRSASSRACARATLRTISCSSSSSARPSGRRSSTGVRTRRGAAGAPPRVPPRRGFSTATRSRIVVRARAGYFSRCAVLRKIIHEFLRCAREQGLEQQVRDSARLHAHAIVQNVHARARRVGLPRASPAQPTRTPPLPADRQPGRRLRHGVVAAAAAGAAAYAVPGDGLPRGAGLWRKHYTRERDGGCPGLSASGLWGRGQA